MAHQIVFYIIGSLVVLSALGVLLFRSPIRSALSLVVSLVMISFLFFTLNAGFLASVQLAVYAGAVAVLFIMIFMMLDLEHPEKPQIKIGLKTSLKLFVAGTLLSILITTAQLSSDLFFSYKGPKNIETDLDVTKQLSMRLFTNHILTFEVIGLLLLLIAVGSVTIIKLVETKKGDSHDSQ